ncbi:hypothetical protein J8273_6345 [Carpediemonas membranifera]|uniref:Uncharacterized protein n=1 Tax=Carpediemonas membranifera TaxID=201153 RepID=A0A8J6ASX7_9EUKA|nr:hypothetical protein J8273_6345 [Carpediemonas membranifera]|eukprot:KAG9391580.1 hypothetical protein J8273_6345 [Carpediemonas membranifera]
MDAFSVRDGGVEFTIFGNTTERYSFPQLIPCDKLPMEGPHPCPLVYPDKWPWNGTKIAPPDYNLNEKSRFFYLAEVHTKEEDPDDAAFKSETKAYNRKGLKKAFDAGPGQVVKLVYRPSSRSGTTSPSSPEFDMTMNIFLRRWSGVMFLENAKENKTFLDALYEVLEDERTLLLGWIADGLPNVSRTDAEALVEVLGNRSQLTMFDQKARRTYMINEECREKNDEVTRLANRLLELIPRSVSTNQPQHQTHIATWTQRQTQTQAPVLTQMRRARQKSWEHDPISMIVPTFHQDEGSTDTFQGPVADTSNRQTSSPGLIPSSSLVDLWNEAGTRRANPEASLLENKRAN